MKIIAGLMFFILLGVNAYAQQEGKVIAEIAASNERTIKNSPFSAEAISESVQVLADGNRIVRSSTSKLYRNSEGRFRREVNGGTGGVFGTSFAYGPGISIVDPVIGHRVMLDSMEKTARVIELGSGQNAVITGSLLAARGLTDAQRAEVEAKVTNGKLLTDEQREEFAAKAADLQKKAAELRGKAVTLTATAPVAVGGFVGDGGGFVYSTGQGGKYETRSEDLGTNSFEGVSAEGTRRITTIPAGAIGNERPIEIVYERWYSKELGIVVYSKHSDPRFGEQTYRVTNIVRSEPDPSLFTVPHGYTVLPEPPTVYRMNTKPTAPAQSVTYARPSTAPRAPAAATVNVKNTKP